MAEQTEARGIKPQQELDTLIAKMNKPRRVLLVDDNETYLDVVGAWLEDQKIEVVKATTPEAGIEAYEQQEFDWAIIDLVFPKESTGLDGIDLVKHIRGIDPVSPPIVLLTGYADHERLKTLGSIPGPVTVFSKPYVNLETLSKFLFGGRR